MDALVVKKLEKLKMIANQYCKESVKERLAQTQPKRFKDVNSLTEWFIKLPGVQEDQRFKDCLQKYEVEMNKWIEAYKYIKPYDSPYFIPIIDSLLNVYERAEFYSKDPTKDIDITKNISFKLMLYWGKDADQKALMRMVQAKRNEMEQAKSEQPHKPPVQQPTTVVKQPPEQPRATTVQKPVQPPATVTTESQQTTRPTQVQQKPKPPPKKDTEAIQPPPVQAPVPSQPPPQPIVTPATQPAQPRPRNVTPPPNSAASSRMQIETPIPPLTKVTQPAVQPDPQVRPPPRPSPNPRTQPTVSNLVERPRIVRQNKTHDQIKAILGIIKQMDFIDSERKDIAQLLRNQLNAHMKQRLKEVIKLAKLHNPNNNRFGDEFKYFSKGQEEERNFKFEQPLEAKVRLNFFKIKEPNKLAIYSALRNFEEKEQEKLRVEDTKKRKDNERDIISFVRSVPRNIKQHVFSEETTMSDKLTVKLPMVQTALEMDPYYRDSELLRRSYMS